MTAIFVSITGPGTAEDLENSGRETVARNGYQVGNFTIEQDLTAEDSGIVGSLDVEDRLANILAVDGMIDLRWGEYSVEAEMP